MAIYDGTVLYSGIYICPCLLFINDVSIEQMKERDQYSRLYLLWPTLMAPHRTPPFRRRGLVRVLRRRHPHRRLRCRRPPRGSVQSRVDRVHTVRQDIHTLLPLRGAQKVPPETEAASVPLSNVRKGEFSKALPDTSTFLPSPDPNRKLESSCDHCGGCSGHAKLVHSVFFIRDTVKF